MRTPWYLHGVAVHAMHVKPGWKQGRCGHKQQLEHALRGARVCVAPCLMRASRAARGRNGLHADTSRMSACCLRGRRQQPAHMPSRKPTSQAGLVRGAVEHRRRPVGHGGPVQRGGRAPAAAAAAEPVAVLDAVLCGVPCQVLPLPASAHYPTLLQTRGSSSRCAGPSLACTCPLPRPAPPYHVGKLCSMHPGTHTACQRGAHGSASPLLGLPCR